MLASKYLNVLCTLQQPEMEMVANGLKKNIQESERERLLALYKGLCPSDSHRAAAEALGFVRY